MKIGIVGNCQSGVTAAWLRKMLPNCEIAYHSIAQSPEAYGPAGDDLASCDTIISQFIGPEHGPLGSDALKSSGSRFIGVPNLVFTGFQPDMGYLHYDHGGIVVSPVGAYHSRIIAACFYAGYGPIRTKAMFNSYIFQMLGYFEEFDKARLSLEHGLAQHGFPVSFEMLMERGVFMHSINHANIFANRLLALGAARKAGLVPVDDIEDIVDEMLEDTVWPVYPQIATRAMIPGGDMTFSRATHLAKGEDRRIDLDRMVEASFEIYAREKDRVDFGSVHRDTDIIRSAVKRKYL